MRELISKLIVLLTAVLILILSIIFGLSQNQEKTELKTISLDFVNVQKGKELFIKQGCLRCHSIGGKGNKRNPLDDIGKRYSNEILEKLIVGEESIEENIPKRVFKQRYKKLTPNELKALVEYIKFY